MEKGNIVIYKEKKGNIQFKVKFEDETVWLSQKQMAELFKTERSVITKHIRNILKSRELIKNQVCAIFAQTASDGKTYRTQFYNLDMIISVGYRVNSKKGTQFRVWATKILKNHLIQGFTLNKKALEQKRILRLAELERAISFLKRITENKRLEQDEAQGLLQVITDYAYTWTLLEKYDQDSFEKETKAEKAVCFDYIEAKELIRKLKAKLKAPVLFGAERGEDLGGILGNLNQEIAGKPVYKSKAEKAANLLYLVIKDHVFIDGNKRIASFLFILFLRRNNFLYNKKGEKVINDTALVALALMVAESKTQDKDVMINLIVNLLNK